MEIPSTGSGQALHSAKNAPFRMKAFFERCHFGMKGAKGCGNTQRNSASPIWVTIDSKPARRDKRKACKPSWGRLIAKRASNRWCKR
jgi:hypothetical protein